MMDPSLCRMVIFNEEAGDGESKRLAAVVTAVYDHRLVDLTVFPPGGMHPYPVTGIPPVEAVAHPVGSWWEWPPRA